MAKYDYTLPSGATFSVTVSDDISQAEADVIFYSQVAAGTFVGYSVGDQLTTAPIDQISLDLSRLERGTAGIPGEVQAAVAVTPVQNPINQADYINVNYNPPGIGPLSPQEVKALLAQTIKTTDQPADVVTQELGVGLFGQNTVQLEKAGILKPGTATRFMDNDPIDLPNPSNFVEVLRTPSVWTGRDGITSLEKYLSDPIKQTQVQVTLMQQSYQSLIQTGLVKDLTNNPVALVTGQVFSGATGTLQTLNAQTLLSGASAITGTVSSSLGNITLDNVGSKVSTALDSAGTNITNLATTSAENVSALLQNATKYGVEQAGAWVKGIGTNLTGAMNNLGKMAQFASNFAKEKLNSLVSGVQAAGGFEATMDRKVLDNAVTKVLGSDKIPTPEFTIPDLGTLDIAQAKNLLNQAQGAVQQAQGAVNQIQGTIKALTSQATSTVNAVQNQATNITNNFRV